jgi:CRP-like cAMP-binding protein
MTIEDDIAFLQRIPILRPLGATALRILAIGAESSYFERGQVLFKAGDPADGGYIVQKGSFQLEPEKVGENELLAGPGTLLGESALFTETRRPATATALEVSMVLRISRAMFVKMLEGYPDAAERLRDLIAARADEWARDFENVRSALTPENDSNS